MYKRDFSAPTLEDHFNKTILPKVMQVSVLAEGAQPIRQGLGVLGRGEQQVLPSPSAVPHKFFCSPGQELWALGADEVHTLGGPGHHLL